MRDITHDPDDAAILRAVIAMAHGLNLITVAEGVETDPQRDFLQLEGCDNAQGLLYSPGLPASEFRRWLAVLSVDGSDS